MDNNVQNIRSGRALAGFFRTVFAIFARAMMAPERISHKHALIKMNGISFSSLPRAALTQTATAYRVSGICG